MRTLYHVTREAVLFDITKNGVDPKKATGKLRASWWVDLESVAWALAHVSARWGVPVDKLIVCEYKFLDNAAVRWTLKGVFYCVDVIHPDTFWGYEKFLKPEV